MFFEQMHPGWQQLLPEARLTLQAIEQLLPAEVLPPRDLVMRAFGFDPEIIKVVILGQDPYPSPGDAVGLAFAMPVGQQLPRSLKNIVRELEQDLSIRVSDQIDLARWQEQGVMLLNSSLTTSAHQAAAHSKLGWQSFTLSALQQLALEMPYVILAWGNHAKALAAQVGGAARVLESAHPSPLSANSGFFGSKPFSRANSALIELGLEPIDWSL